VVRVAQAIYWYKDVTESSIVGDKAQRIARLHTMGLPVSPGFIVSADVFRAFLLKTAIGAYVDEALAYLSVNDEGALKVVTDDIQQMVVSTPIPDQLREFIVEAYHALDVDPAIKGTRLASLVEDGKNRASVVVRSSPLCDGGQQAAFLDVVGDEMVLAAVQSAWASLFTPRAIYVREKKNERDASMGVLVQKMVQSDAGGMVYSVAKGNDQCALIEAGYGMSDAVVTGEITPDAYIVDKRKVELKEKNVSCKPWGYARQDNKTVKIDVPLDAQSLPALSGFEAKKLTEYAVTLESYYGKPQEIEFVIQKGRPMLLQSKDMKVRQVVAPVVREEVKEKN